MNSSDTTTITETPPQVIVKDITIYSIFEEASVYDNILDEEWLNCTPAGIAQFAKSGLRGKITLPKTVNGITIKMFDGFGTALNRYPSLDITHIFWEPGSEVRKYGDHAFELTGSESNNTLLKYVQIPNSNFVLGDRVFMYQRKLFNDSKVTQNDIDNFFNKIINYGSQVFNTTYESNGNTFLNNKILKISGLVDGLNYSIPELAESGQKAIAYRAFGSTRIGTIQFGDTEHPFSYAYIVTGRPEEGNLIIQERLLENQILYFIMMALLDLIQKMMIGKRIS